MSRLPELIRRFLHSQFFRFALVGTGGALADIAALYFAIHALALDLYSGRIFSFLCAVSFTFFANRAFTFKGRGQGPLWRQWLVFSTSQLGGLAANYAIYAVMVTYWPLARDIPAIAVAAGALVGLAFNFIAARRLVFRAGA